MSLLLLFVADGGPTPPAPPTPTPTPTPSLQSGHVIWGKVAGEWRATYEGESKDRLPPALVEHLRELEREANAPPIAGKSEREVLAELSARAMALQHMGLGSAPKKTAPSVVSERKAEALARVDSRAQMLQRQIDEEDELLLFFEGNL